MNRQAPTTPSKYDRLGSNQVRDLRCAVSVEPVDRILQDAVGIRDTFMLAQVLEPGLHKESFHHPSFDCSIFECSPRVGTIASALMTQLFKRGEEDFAVAWIVPIFDRDQHRSTILLDVMGDD